MVTVAISPFLDDCRIPSHSTIVTAVLPGGCQARCSFCFVAQRRERDDQSGMEVDAVPKLLQAIDTVAELGAAGIVGDEPLHGPAWPYTSAFLACSQKLGKPTALITNGIELATYLERLAAHPTLKITVSIDGLGARHDQIRRSPGAFRSISEGLDIARSTYKELHRNLSISTVITNKNIDQLPGIVDLAAYHGVQSIYLSPILVSRPNFPLRANQKILEVLLKGLPALKKVSQSRRVQVNLSDELGALEEWEEQIVSMGIRVLRPTRSPSLLRIDARGRVETYQSIRTGRTLDACLDFKNCDVEMTAKRLVRMTKES